MIAIAAHPGLLLCCLAGMLPMWQLAAGVIGAFLQLRAVSDALWLRC